MSGLQLFGSPWLDGVSGRGGERLVGERRVSRTRSERLGGECATRHGVIVFEEVVVELWKINEQLEQDRCEIYT